MTRIRLGWYFLANLIAAISRQVNIFTFTLAES